MERDENRILLKENGRVIWLRRAVEDLPLDGRPVSRMDGPEAIFQRREPLYRSWSDQSIDCIGVEETADIILSND